MFYTDVMKDYARDLYFEPDFKGGHRYSFRQIATEMQQKFKLPKSPNISTISRWASDNSSGASWEDEWNSSIVEGIANSYPSSDLLNSLDRAKSKVEDFHRLLSYLSCFLVAKGFDFYNSDDFVVKDSKEAAMVIKLGLSIAVSQNNVFKVEVDNLKGSNESDIHEEIKEYNEWLKSIEEG